MFDYQGVWILMANVRLGVVQEVADADSPSVWRRYHSPLARSVWEPRVNNSGTIMVSPPWNPPWNPQNEHLGRCELLTLRKRGMSGDFSCEMMKSCSFSFDLHTGWVWGLEKNRDSRHICPIKQRNRASALLATRNTPSPQYSATIPLHPKSETSRTLRIQTVYKCRCFGFKHIGIFPCSELTCQLNL